MKMAKVEAIKEPKIDELNWYGYIKKIKNGMLVHTMMILKTMILVMNQRILANHGKITKMRNR